MGKVFARKKVAGIRLGIFIIQRHISTMAANNELCIVSAFGRGNWLAMELAQAGMRVSLLDVSHKLGRWTPEDQEGPFGFFASPELSESQINRVFEGENLVNCSNGFCLWLENGPLELTGPLYKHKMKDLEISEDCQKYLQDYHLLDAKNKNAYRDKLYAAGFQKSFLAQIAHQLSSNRFETNEKAILKGRPLPIYSSYYLRRNSRRALNASLNRVEQAGVEVFKEAEVLDLSFANKRLQGAEASVAGRSIFVKSNRTLWQLSSAETAFFNPDIYPMLFTKPKVVSRWSWVRYQINIKPSLARGYLPHISVVIKDFNLPWTHENFMFLNRNVKENCFDVWLKLPTGKRFQKFYLEEILKKIETALSKKLGKNFMESFEYPQEYTYGFEDLGPSRNPIYFSKDIEKLGHANVKNIFWDGPEQWQGLDWFHQFLHQNIVKNKIFSDYQTENRGSSDTEIQP